MNVDLHTHTFYSDGTLSPKQLVKKAYETKLKAIAITDHDTIQGIPDAIEAGRRHNLEVIPGVELTCDIPFSDIHLLGLFIDINNPELNLLLNKAKEARIQQKKEVIKKLYSLGFDISYEEVSAQATGEISRVHIAKMILEKYPDNFPDLQSVFDRVLATNQKGWASRDFKINIDEAVSVIKKAGGISVLAHPEYYPNVRAEELIPYFKKIGGVAMETYYPYDKCGKYKGVNIAERDRIIKNLKEHAKKLQLLESGGSDFHGENKKTILGEMQIKYELLTLLKNRADPEK